MAQRPGCRLRHPQALGSTPGGLAGATADRRTALEARRTPKELLQIGVGYSQVGDAPAPGRQGSGPWLLTVQSLAEFGSHGYMEVRHALLPPSGCLIIWPAC